MEEDEEDIVRWLLEFCCWVGAISTFFVLSMFAWAMRDGMGSDSIESFGWNAFHRWFWLVNSFHTQATGTFVLVPLRFIFTGLLLHWVQVAKQNRVSIRKLSEIKFIRTRKFGKFFDGGG